MHPLLLYVVILSMYGYSYIGNKVALDAGIPSVYTINAKVTTLLAIGRYLICIYGVVFILLHNVTGPAKTWHICTNYIIMFRSRIAPSWHLHVYDIAIQLQTLQSFSAF